MPYFSIGKQKLKVHCLHLKQVHFKYSKGFKHQGLRDLCVGFAMIEFSLGWISRKVLAWSQTQT